MAEPSAVEGRAAGPCRAVGRQHILVATTAREFLSCTLAVVD